MFLISGILDAVDFLTIIKFGKEERKTENLKASIKFFPVAGLFIGAVLAGVFYIFNKFSSIPLSVIFSLLCLFIITGGLHFDGLADTADGLFAYLKTGDKIRFYRAMKDVNTGFAGNAAVIFYILIIWAAVGGINIKFAYLSLFTFPLIGRYSIVLSSYFLNTPEYLKGTGTVFTEGTNLFTLIFASVLTVVITYLFLNLSGIFSLSVSAFAVLLSGLYFSRKFGGVNGDMLGFTVKMSEIVYMIALFGFYRVLS